MIHQQEINKALENHRSFCQKKFNMEELVYRLNCEPWFIKNRVIFRFTNFPRTLGKDLLKYFRKGYERFWVDGEYYEQKDVVIICISTILFKRIKVGNFDNLKFLLSITIQHELLHRNQAFLRNNPGIGSSVDKFVFHHENHDEDKLYYGMHDEIDAHSHDIALELTRTPVFEILKITGEKLENYSIPFNQSETYRRYYETFGTVNHPVMRRLIKKAYKDIFNNGIHWDFSLDIPRT